MTSTSNSDANSGRSRSHVCDDTCAHTIDVGYVHTPDGQGRCLPSCPHPHHSAAASADARSQT